MKKKKPAFKKKIKAKWKPVPKGNKLLKLVCSYKGRRLEIDLRKYKNFSVQIENEILLNPMSATDYAWSRRVIETGRQTLELKAWTGHDKEFPILPESGFLA